VPRDVPRETQRLTAALAALLLALGGSPSRAAVSVERGAYLAAAAGCDQCHTDTKNGGQPYAGGRALETPFGTVFTPNITPDPQTGIGRWNSADFTRALRAGIAPDDSHYLPVFPFVFYDRLTENDVADLETFLRTVTAVRQVNRSGDARSPSFARARAAIRVVAEPFAGPWRPDPSRSPTWNRGAYIAATVGRCGDCHTPRDWFGARDPTLAFSGTSGRPGAKGAPNITPDPDTGIGKWSESDIITLLKDGQMPDFDFVGGAMAEIVRNTSRLDDADRRAIAVYLQSLPAVHSKKKEQ
jgi:mono/diheme cytochrome c family protein